jgi:hypothetical protein
MVFGDYIFRGRKNYKGYSETHIPLKGTIMIEDTKTVVAVVVVSVATVYAVNGLYKLGKDIVKEIKIRKAEKKSK